MNPRKPLNEYYFKTNMGYQSPCWIWNGAVSKEGYGHMKANCKNVRAHVYFFLEYRGEYDRTQHLHHLCNIRLCVHPWHLYPMTPAEHNQLTHKGKRYRRIQ